MAKKKSKVIRFQDELIRGKRVGPGFISLFQGDRFNYGPLLKLRKDFIPEMRRTSGILYRKVGVEEAE